MALLPHPFRSPTSQRPEPPVTMPEGRLVQIAGRGEFFIRDSGGDGPAVLLLHGWMFASDLNWWPAYAALERTGARVIAMDHRGHGRGLRTSEPFRLTDCAGDAAAVIESLGCGPVVAVGYSMGGPVAQILARDHPQHVAALVCCATAQEWKGRAMSVFWKSMGFIRLGLGLFPLGAWEALLRATGSPASPQRAWVAAELTRGASVDIAEAGRELSRYDARPWLSDLRGLPSAVVITARDRSVPPRKQRELAEALGAETFEVQGDHVSVISKPAEFRAALLAALASVGVGSGTAGRIRAAA